MLRTEAAAAGEAAGAPQTGTMSLVLPIALFIVIFYFLMYRPQKKKQQQHDKMLESIDRGDTVVTAGGFFGRVVDVLEDSYLIELADGVKARILKSSVSGKREAGDEKPRMRRVRRKKRVERKPGDESSNAGEPSPQALEEGVSPEENEALMNDSDVSPEAENGTETEAPRTPKEE
jgi:preprotein translocase subunit YajC